MLAYSSESELSFESDDSNSNYIPGYVQVEVEETVEQLDAEKKTLPSDSSSDNEEQGPYAEEPLADDDWLEQYNRDRERTENRNRELEDWLNGITPVDTW